MHPVWNGLMANLAVVTIFVAGWTYVQALFDRWSPTVRSFGLGTLFGLGAVVTMISTFSPQEGMFLDLRTTLISLAALFGGPIAGVLAGLIAAAYRVYLGGPLAVNGCISIAAVVVLSVGLHLATRKRALRRADIVALGLIVVAPGIVSLFVLPPENLGPTIRDVAVPNAVVHFIANLIAGLALLYEQRRQMALRENHIYRTIIEVLPESLNYKDRDGRFIAANQATAALMHADNAGALIGKTDADFYAPPVAARFRQEEIDIIAKGASVTIDQKLPRLDGRPTWLSTLKLPLFDKNGAPMGIITHNRDITAHRKLAEALEESRQQLSYAMAQMADGVAMFDKSGKLVFCNEQYRASFPRTQDVRVPGVHMRDMLRAAAEREEQISIPRDDVEGWLDRIEAGLHVESEEEVHLFDGRWLHVRTRPSGDGACMVVVSDITTIKSAETDLLALTEQLHQQAVTDGLTGLLNRRAFDQALDAELSRSGRDNSWVSLLLMDIDRFKAFNDHYGHQEGDACLQAVSAEFARILKRPADVVARYGGEEFVAILPGTDEDGAFFIADEYLRAVRALNIAHVGSEKGIVTVSIGMACYRPGDRARLGAELIHWADQAMYDAKLAGRDRLMGWKERRGLGAA